MSLSPETIVTPAPLFITIDSSALDAFHTIHALNPDHEMGTSYPTKSEQLFPVIGAILQVGRLKIAQEAESARLKRQYPQNETVNVYLLDILPHLPANPDTNYAGLISFLNTPGPTDKAPELTEDETACLFAYTAILEITKLFKPTAANNATVS